jgi:hypothetical protein
MYVYIKSEPRLWTVGFYRPNGIWEPESDHSTQKAAAERVHYLNGGKNAAVRGRVSDANNYADEYQEAA